MLTQPMAQHIELWPIDKFIPYARNPRKNDALVDRMAASIQEFGFKIPVLARSSGEVVDGHLRLKAARKLDLTEIPVILCDEWTDAQVKAFRLMVNRSVTNTADTARAMRRNQCDHIGSHDPERSRLLGPIVRAP